jgi:putative NADH-flavin reductase
MSASTVKKPKSSSKKWTGPQEGDLVCVTGANGFLASHIVKQLLERGYRVRGTVRSTKDEAKTNFLKELPGAKKRLELVDANLTDAGAFDEAFEDCKWVIHSASPFTFKYTDAQVRHVGGKVSCPIPSRSPPEFTCSK